MTSASTTYRTVTPYLIVPDADVETRFLQAAFCAALSSCQRNPDGSVMHTEIHLDDSLLMLGQASPQWPARQAAFYLWVPDVDATYQQALDAGTSSESAPEDKPCGHCNAGVIDANLITWWIGSVRPSPDLTTGGRA